ncbi:hypothetical protein [uncultured Polaribacter sp.]|uniref:hypothetical protein n=1 Tax=uncultured Polaribacter sp. TaxID=174711 RepID=UPI00262D2E6D|nr:hypothetical protein [uncultured Polaribacter sp.]
MIKLRNDVYPRTLENIEAVFLYYYPEEKHSTINKYAAKLYDERVMQLNEIEFVSEVIATHSEIIKKHFKLNFVESAMKVLFNACSQVLLKQEKDWNISKNGKKDFVALKLDLQKVL